MKRIGTVVVVVLVLAGAFVFFRDTAVAPQNGTVQTLEANITVTAPRSGATVSNPITVTGKARVFENTFAYALKDGTGKKLYESYGMTDAPDAGVFGNYTVKVPVPVGAPRELFVEVFEYSAKDGSVTNLVRVPVTLSTQETMKVKAFFGNAALDPENTCTKVFPVEREVVKTKEVAYLALTELLKGVGAGEKGYFTSIPKGVRLNSLVIRGSTAYADFDGTLDYQVGGSCRVSAIRAQLTQTLKQFPSVKDVVISIYGRTEDILQP